MDARQVLGDSGRSATRLEWLCAALDGAPSDVAPAQSDLPALNAELGDWLADDRQWQAGHARQWTSLLDDLVLAKAECGSRLQDHLAQDHESLWSELVVCRAGLRSARGDRRPPDNAMRRRLARCCDDLASLTASASARIAAWQDVIESSTFRDAERRLLVLRSILASQGLDPKQILRQIRGVLSDDALMVAFARGEAPPRDGRHEPAGVEANDRIDLAESLLLKPPVSAATVVWLRYALAPMRNQPTLAITPTVTLYGAEFLKDEIAQGRSPSHTELSDPDSAQAIERLARNAGPDDPGWKEVPYALARVDLGHAHLAEAEALARETAELIVALATIHRPHADTWILADDHVMFRDGQQASGRHSAPVLFEPTFEQATAVMRDRTPAQLADWPDRLTGYLPLHDRELRKAARLAVWLRRTKATWEPGRIVLCDRVIEQVAGWAGIADRGRFVHDYVRLQWAFRHVYSEIFECWSDVFEAGEEGFAPGEIEDSAWREIKADPTLEFEHRGRGWKVNMRGVVRRAPFVLDRVEQRSPLSERMQRLCDQTASGPATAAWISRLLGEFDVLERRARRVRNSLIHGGPVNEAAAATILPFVELVAGDALYEGILGYLSDSDSIDHFIDLRDVNSDRLERLRAGAQPADALWDTAG